MIDLIKKRRLQERLILFILLLCTIISVFITFAIIFILLTETIFFFKEVSFKQFFFDKQWTPLFVNKHFGIWPLICGTFLTSIIAMSTAIPLGLMSAIYLSEYAPERIRKILKPFF